MSEPSHELPSPLVNDDKATTRSFDVGGRNLIAAISGSGPMTVILETGLGAESDEWRAVQNDLSKVAHALRYDRASRGLSDPARGPRSAAMMLDDLDALLAAACLTGPFLLVGHSFGGLLMRLFANRRRERVCGLVLVDALQRDQFDVFGALFPPPQPGEPPELASLRAFWTGGWRDPQSTTERIDMPTSLVQDQMASDLGDLPIRILAAAATFLNNPKVPPLFRPVLQSRWNELQRTFLMLSTRTELTMVEGSGHFIQRDNPMAIVAAVCGMIDDVRKEQSVA